MNFKYFNKGLTKKILAGTIAGIMSLSGVPKIVYGATNKSNTNTNTSISSNACYDEVIGTMNTVGGEFKIYKLHDGSIKAKHIGEKFTDDIIIKKDGTINATIIKKEKNGNISTINETFKINNFFGDSIDINYNLIKNSQIKQTAIMLQKYINSLEFKDENYIKKYCENPSEQNKEKANQQRSAVYKYLESTLKDNKMKYSASFASASIPIYNDIPWGNILSEEGIIEAKEIMSALAEEYGSKLLGGTELSIILVPIMLISAEYLPVSTSTKGLTEEELKNAGKITAGTLGLISGYAIMADAKDDIIRNMNDNDENNDCYRASLNSLDNEVYIDFSHPLSKYEAANIIKTWTIHKSTGPQDPAQYNVYNIYTPKNEDAKEIIELAGGKAGNGYIVGIPENHAFVNYQDLFDVATGKIKLTGINLSDRIQPGTYYWHYHFTPKKVSAGALEDNENHVMFGIPITITQNDIDNFSKKDTKITINDLDKHKSTFIDNRDYSSSFRDFAIEPPKTKIKK